MPLKLHTKNDMRTARRTLVYGLAGSALITPKDCFAFWFLLRGLGGLGRGGLRGGVGVRGSIARGGRVAGVATTADIATAFNEVRSPMARAAGVSTWEFVSRGQYNGMGVHLSTRHFYGKLGRPNSSGNSVYIGESASPIVRDFEAVVAGRIRRSGEDFHAPSGIVWRWERNPAEGINALYPVRGPNIVNLTNFEYNMLRNVQERGVAEAIVEMENLRVRSVISNESYIQLRSLMAIFEG
jgi:hypothetical protein